MKVGILTRRFGFNMGSSLQAFAMVNLINSLGHDAEIIDYDETCQHPRWRIRPAIEHFLYHISYVLPYCKRNYLKHRMAQEKRFRNFESRYLPLGKSAKASNELHIIAKEYNKIVVGSDQIWSPFLFDTNFFGSFLDKADRGKIVPYAPSIGTSDSNLISVDQKDLIKSLKFLSCREKAGAEIISEITGKEVPVVLDPTLMVNSSVWNRMADDNPIDGLPEQYVLTYFLGATADLKERYKAAQERNAKIVNINMFNRPNNINADIDIKEAGPAEFLYLVKHASKVLTDSFHATIFSWIFGIEFTVFERFKTSDIQNQNSRIYTLLEILGAQTALFNRGSEFNGKPIINKCRHNSYQYLLSALNQPI